MQRTVLSKLQEAGLRKLPEAVILALLDRVQDDLNIALRRSVARRTTSKAVAKLFAECVLRQGGGLKGGDAPFDQLGSANLDRDETGTLIGTHSDHQKDDSEQGVAQ